MSALLTFGLLAALAVAQAASAGPPIPNVGDPPLSYAVPHCIPHNWPVGYCFGSTVCAPQSQQLVGVCSMLKSSCGTNNILCPSPVLTATVWLFGQQVASVTLGPI